MASENKENNQIEPFWKGILSWQAALALVCAAAFYLTIVNPDRTQPVPVSVAKGRPLLSEQVLDEASKLSSSQLLKAGKADAAIIEADKEVRSNPYDLPTLIAAGNVYCDVTEADKSKGCAYLEKSVALCPQNPFIRLNYARHLAKSKKIEEAVAQYELLDKDQSEPWSAPRVELSDLYLVKNATAKAVDILRKVMQNDPQNGEAQERLGLALARNNDDQEGFDEFSKGFAVRQSKNNLTELKNYIDGFENDKQKAEAALQKEVKEQPENQNKIILLGELYLSEGKQQAAKDLIATN